MKEPAHFADEIVAQALSPLFLKADLDPLPDHLGREVYGVLRRRLQASGFPGAEHAQDVFSMAMIDALSYLERHGVGEIRHPRGWLHRVTYRAMIHYLKALRSKQTLALTPLLDGEMALEESSPIASDEQILHQVREALKSLTPRHREFLELDLIALLPPEEIQKRMGIASYGYFRKLKCNALAALRDKILSL